MTEPDQHQVIAFLARPDTHGLGTRPVERIDTHISVVFLAGNRAYKLKRAVRFPYLDYTTLERRRAACEREVSLNRRTAPDVYRATIAVTAEPDGRLVLGGTGKPVEWLVEMARFDQATLLDRMAAEGRLDVPLVASLARTVAAFHEHARPRREHGGEAAMRDVVDGNLREMLADTSGTLDRAECSAVHAAASATIARHALLLEGRRVHGLVRQCHGDLHLHNVCLINGRPTLFDAIEFNDDFACLDVMYDFAFLLMDLLHRTLAGHANAALNAYLVERHDYAGLALLPLFLSCRAAIRAKVSVAEADVQPDGTMAAALRAEAREYLQLARRFLETRPPTMVAVGGLSGSGKSTIAALLAAALGPPPGAVIIRTDVIRKQMFGSDLLSRLPVTAYEPEVTTRVYAKAFHAAEACVRSGQSAIVDAVFADPFHREAIARLAAQARVTFSGLWLDVPYRVAVRRLHARTLDASDADPAVLRAQAQRDVGKVSWTRIDGSGEPDEVARRAARVLDTSADPAARASAGT